MTIRDVSSGDQREGQRRERLAHAAPQVLGHFHVAERRLRSVVADILEGATLTGAWKSDVRLLSEDEVDALAFDATSVTSQTES